MHKNDKSGRENHSTIFESVSLVITGVLLVNNMSVKYSSNSNSVIPDVTDHDLDVLVEKQHVDLQ